jgi:hypothetical protein
MSGSNRCGRGPPCLSRWVRASSILRKDADNINCFLGVTVPCGEDCEAIGAAIDAEHRFALTLKHTGINGEW